MATLKKQMPAFTPTRGHAWPILYDPTTAFVKEGSKKPGPGTTVGGSVDGSAMDIDTPTPAGGPRESPVRLSHNNQSSPTNEGGQISVTMPLLNAIRTTAAHVQQAAASRTQHPDGQKRIIKSAMFLGMASSLALTDEVVASPVAVPDPSSLPGPTATLVRTKADDDATHASVSGKRVASPKVGMSVQASGADGGTPLGERSKKKKKRSECNCPIVQAFRSVTSSQAATKDAQTPISAGSPPIGPV